MAEQREPGAEVGGGLAEEARTAHFDAFIDDLRRAGTPEPRQVAEAVLCALTRRLSQGDLEHLEGVLPQEVQDLIQPCHQHPGEERLDREEFLTDIAEHLGVASDRVEPLVLAVFGAIRDRIPDDEIARVASQLPADLADLLRRPV